MTASFESQLVRLRGNRGILATSQSARAAAELVLRSASAQWFALAAASPGDDRVLAIARLLRFADVAIDAPEVDASELGAEAEQCLMAIRRSSALAKQNSGAVKAPLRLALQEEVGLVRSVLQQVCHNGSPSTEVAAAFLVAIATPMSGIRDMLAKRGIDVLDETTFRRCLEATNEWSEIPTSGPASLLELLLRRLGLPNNITSKVADLASDDANDDGG